jgi:hypothetical protein
MDPRDMLISNSLDTMVSIPTVEKGRTLEGFSHGDLTLREYLFEVITCPKGPC